MSNEIDERVVQLQFDNKQFERGVKESMDSLRRFNESLNSMESTSKMSQIADTVSTLTNRFSMMGTIGGRVLEQLTDRAVAFGSRMLRSLNQTREGWSRYESEMNATRTTMNATGKSMEEVERVFEKLAEYSDQTSYSLSDMQSNFSILTSTGAIRDLERAEQVMEGIANAAAYAGIGIRQAAWPMQTFTRAMSEGYMTRIRWNSLQSAKIVNPELMQQFIEAGIRQGTLTKEGKVKGKNIKITESNFESSLQYKWLTADVMSDAFSAYADRTDGIGKIAYAAAKEARTFTDVLDTLKDVISTGWGTSFKLIFGNVEEAAKLFSWMAEEVADVAAKIAEFRNNLLRGWKEGGGRDSLVKAITGIWLILKKVGSLITTALKNVFGTPTADMLINFTNKLETAVRNVYKWLGGNVFENLEKNSEKIAPRFVLIRNAIEGVLSVAKALKNIAWEAVKFIGNLFGANFKTFDEFLLVIGRAGRLITNLVNAVHKAEIVPRFFTWLYNTIKPLAPILAFMMASWVMKGGLAAFFGANSGILGTIFKIIAGGLKLISVVGVVISTVTLAVAAFKFVAGVVQSIGPAFEAVKGKVVDVWNSLKTFFSGIGTEIGNAFSNGFSGIASKIVGAFEYVKRIVIKWFDSLKTGFPSLFEDIGNKFIDWYKIIRQRVKTFINSIPSTFESVKKTISGWLTTIRSWLVSSMKSVINVIPGIIDTLKTWFDAARSYLVTAMKGILNVWPQISDSVKRFFEEMKKNVGNAIPVIWSSITNFFGNLWTNVTNWINTEVPAAWESMKNAVSGFGASIVAGVAEAFPKAWQAVQSFGERIFNGIFGEEGDKSKSGEKASNSDTTGFSNHKGYRIRGHIASASVSDSGFGGTKKPETVMDRVTRLATNTFNQLKTKFETIWNAIKSWVVEKATIVSNWFTSGEAATFVMSIIHSVQSFFTNAASSILDALAPAITWVSNTWNRVKEAVSEFATNNIIPIFNRVKSWVSEKAKAAFDAVVTWLKTTWASLKETFSNKSGEINFTFFINTMLALLPVLILLKRITNLVKAFENIRTERLFALSVTLIGVVGGMTAITFILINHVPGMLNSLGTALSAISDFVQRYHMAILIGGAVMALSLLSIGLMRIGRALISARRNMANTFSIFNMGKSGKDSSLVEVLAAVGSLFAKIAIPIITIAASVGILAAVIRFIGPKEFIQAANALNMIGAFIGILLLAIAGLSLIFSRTLQVGRNNQGFGVFQAAGKPIADALKQVQSLFFSLSALIAVLTGSMAVFGQMDPKQFENAYDRFRSVMTLTALILVVGLAVYSRASRQGSVDVKGFASLAAGVAVMVAVVAGAYILLKKEINKGNFGDKEGDGLNLGALIGAIVAIGALTIALGYAMGRAAEAGKSKKMLSAFIGMAILVMTTISSLTSLSSEISKDPASVATAFILSAALLGEMLGALSIMSKTLRRSRAPTKMSQSISRIFWSMAGVMFVVTWLVDACRGMTLEGVAALAAIFVGLVLCIRQLVPLMEQASQMSQTRGLKPMKYLITVFAGLAGVFLAVGFASQLARGTDPWVVAAMTFGVAAAISATALLANCVKGVTYKSLLGAALILVGLGGCFALLGWGASIARDVDWPIVASVAAGVAIAVLAAALVVHCAKGVKFTSLAGASLIIAGLALCFLAIGKGADIARGVKWELVAAMGAGVTLAVLAAATVVKATRTVRTKGTNFTTLAGASLVIAGLGACFVGMGFGAKLAKGVDLHLVLAMGLGVAAAVLAAAVVVNNTKSMRTSSTNFSTLAGASLVLVGLGTCFTFLGHAADLARGVDTWLVVSVAGGVTMAVAAASYIVSAAKDVSFTSLSGVALILAAIGGCFVALGYASQLARDTDPWLVAAMTGGMAACILAIALVVGLAKDVKFSSLAGVALIFAGLGVCIILLGEAVKLMNKVEWDAVWRTLAVMGASLLAILAIMGILKLFDSIADAAAKGAWGLIKVLGIVSIGVAVILAVVALIATVIAHLGYDALTTFGSGLEQFGGNMEQFYESTKNFTTADFQRICDCVKIIYEMIRDYIVTVNFDLWKTYNDRLYSFRNRLNYLYNDLSKMNPETLKNRLGMLTDIKTAVESLDGMPDVSDDLTALGGAIALFYGSMNKTSFTDADGNEINVDSINFEGIREMFNRISQGLPDDKDIEAVGAFADNSEGTKLGRFAIGVTNLSTALDLYLKTLQSYTPDDIQTSGDILSMLQGLAEALPTDTEVDAAIGDVGIKVRTTKKTLSEFAGDVSDLGAALSDLANGVSGAIQVVDEEGKKTNFDVAIEVAGKINEIQQALPTRGFISSWLLGKEDLGHFSTNIAALGRGIKNFALAIKQGNLKDADIAQASAVTDIIKVLAEADKAVSANQAGFLANLTGNSNWDQFTKNMPKLANGLISFVNTINAPENADVEYASDMVIGMLGVLEALSGPLSKLLSGQVTDLYGLNEDLPGLATGLVSLVRGLSGKDGGLTPEDINTANSTLEALGRLFGSTLMEAFARGLAIEVSTANQEGKQTGTLTMNLYKAATMGLTEYVISTFGEGVPQETLDAALESLSSVGFDWGFALLTGIAQGMTDIKTASENEVYAAAVTVSNTIAGYFEEQKFKKQAEDIGKNLDLGLARGVSDEKNKARPVGAFGQVILAMLARARNIAEIHSPSAVTTKYGLYLDQGLSNGITGGAGGVFGSVNGLFDGIFSSVSEWFNGLVTSVSDWFGGLADGLNLGDIGDGVISALNGDWSKVGELVGLDLGDGLLSGIDKAIFGEGGIEGAIFGEGGVMGAIKNYDFKGLLGEETGGRVNDIVGQILPTIENIDFSDPSSAAAALGQINWTSIFGEDSGIAQALGKVDWSTVVTDNLGGTLVNLLGGLDWTTLLGLDFMSNSDLASYENWNDPDLWEQGLGSVSSPRKEQTDPDKTDQSNLGGSGGSGRSSDSSTFGKQTTTVSAGGLVLSATEGYTIGDILNRIDRLENAITHMQIVMDSGVLAGQLAPAMDGALGTQAILGGRWN